MSSGSGKSTLATQVEALYPRHFVRVNQDSLGSRAKCEKLAKQALVKVSLFLFHLTRVLPETRL